MNVLGESIAVMANPAEPSTVRTSTTPYYNITNLNSAVSIKKTEIYCKIC